eukprot:TRINITY_DN3274_c0_g1_i8.p1 TRINITY_DN3274_c0_g1~~TRINITY_DN3274_c0_g1_i8.p1  ORF type:complete len:822 (+),score=98.26 TRINITY_DN3274_c0_g1_i8:28-2466(+)
METIHVCNTCTRVFGSSRALKAHVSNTHALDPEPLPSSRPKRRFSFFPRRDTPIPPSDDLTSNAANEPSYDDHDVVDYNPSVAEVLAEDPGPPLLSRDQRRRVSHPQQPQDILPAGMPLIALASIFTLLLSSVAAPSPLPLPSAVRPLDSGVLGVHSHQFYRFPRVMSQIYESVEMSYDKLINTDLRSDVSGWSQAILNDYYPYDNPVTFRLDGVLSKHDHTYTRPFRQDLLNFIHKNLTVLASLPTNADDLKGHKLSDLNKFERVQIGPGLYFWWRNPLAYIQRAFSMKKRYDAMAFEFKEETEKNAVTDSLDRVFSEPNTAEWWRQTQEQARRRGLGGAKMVPGIFYSDSTQVARFCNRSCHPIYMVLSGDPASVRNSREGRVVVGYIPVITAGVHVEKKWASEVRLHVFHQCIRIALLPFVLTQNTGILMKDPSGNLINVLPCVQAWTGDIPELLKVNCVFGGTACDLRKPCWTCSVSGALLNLFGRHPMRDNYRQEDLVRTWLHGVNTIGQVTLTRKASQAESLAIQKSVFRELWYFDPALCTPNDDDHMFGLGWGKYMIGWLPLLFAKLYPGQSGQAIDILDRAIARISCENFPGVSNYPHGISNKQLCKGTEINAVMEYLPYALGMLFDEMPLDKDISDPVIAVFVHYNTVLGNLRQARHSVTSLNLLKANINQFQVLLLHVFRWVSPVGLKTLKFHRLVHYPDQICFHGVTGNTNTSHSEDFHKVAAKKPFSMTSKKEHLTMLQLVEHTAWHRSTLPGCEHRSHLHPHRRRNATMPTCVASRPIFESATSGRPCLWTLQRINSPS